MIFHVVIMAITLLRLENLDYFKFLFLLVAIKCYHCIENTWSECQQKQTKVTCDDPFPPGNSHCYSVSGEYDNGTVIRGVVARGCVDCKGEGSIRL